MAEDELPLSGNNEFKKACLLRNQNEKRRRDRFNNLVSELSVVLPVTGKKLSRNNVLKYTIEHFRQAKQLAANSEDINSTNRYGRWQPDFVTNEEFRQTMLDGLDCFVLAINEASNIFYVSSNVFSSQGFACNQLLNSSILNIVHPDDQRTIYSLLTSIRQNSPESNSPPQVFTCRFRFGPQIHKCDNSFAAFHCASKSFKVAGHKQEDCCSMVLLGRKLTLPTANKAVVLSDTENVSKFTTRLNKMWRFECVERSTTLVLGYYPFELLGNCFYEYCHSEDLENLTEYHNMLPYSGVITTCCYRLLTKGQVWIWVRSRCHVSYSQLDSKPDSVICVTWPMKDTEFSTLNQEEVLERDRRLFSQILEKNGEKLPMSFKSNAGKFPLSSSSLSSTQDAQSNTELKHIMPPCEEMQMRMVTAHPGIMSHTLDNNSDLSSTSDQFSQGMAGSQSVPAMWSIDTQVDSTAILAPSDGHYSVNESLVHPVQNVNVNSLLLEDSVEMPESLSFSQWALHLHLREQYIGLTESIRQQSEQITVIQRQLAIQKELSELSDELEVQQKLKKQNRPNAFEETRAVILQKMKELQGCTIVS
ncbi:hypothetical protein ACROYT_G037443 [Oculina patagonica]